MKIDPRPIDDLKTERPDIAPALPAYLRLIPVLFYAVVVGGLGLSAYFFFALRSAAAAEQVSKTKLAGYQQDLETVKADRDALEKKARRANDIVAWVEGSRSLQPLVVSMIRAVDANSSVAGLDLTRTPGAPSQIKIVLKLNAPSLRQLDRVLGEITARNFRAYNPNQTQARGAIDYEATLIYQGERAVPDEPAPPAKPPRR